jgi:putative hydrolase of the HAD superfamily
VLIHGIDPSRVKAAVFDLGGVFLAGGVENVRAFGERHGLDASVWSEIRHRLFSNDGPWAAVERGESTLDHFVTQLRDAIRDGGGQVSLAKAYDFMGNSDPHASGGRLRPEIVAAAARVHERMPTALLTNNVTEWRPMWTSQIDVDRLFDVVIDSSQVGVRKPEPRIYEITRERLCVRHSDIFFVDDLGQNLKPARALGWQTLKYDDTQTVLEVLAALAEHRVSS